MANLIRFSCHETLNLSPREIAENILDVSNWTNFSGYGILPGIKFAEFEVRTLGVVGCRIRVANSDGSTHVEEIVEWNPEERLILHMQDFSPPLSRLATDINEVWEFVVEGDATHVVRSFELIPNSFFTSPFLWVISHFLKKAITQHLQQMRETASS